MAKNSNRRTNTLLKLSLPYVSLVVFYFSYLLIGSIIFNAIESQPEKNEVASLKEKEESIKAEILLLFKNQSESGDIGDAEQLNDLLEELVDTVSHPDWVPGRFDTTLGIPDPWAIPNAMLFCMTTITTIGYGDLVPVTTGGRVFVILYSCIGVPLSFLLFAAIGGLLAKVASRMTNFIRKRICYTQSKQSPTTQVNGVHSNGNIHPDITDDSGVVNEVFEYGEGDNSNVKGGGIPMGDISPCKCSTDDENLKKRRKSLQKQKSVFADVTEEDNAGKVPFVVVILLMLSYLCVGAASFLVAERWNYFESFYFTFITLTTIGFGDYTPKHHFENNTHIPCLLYTLVGLCYISMCVTLLQSRFQKLVISIREMVSSLVSSLVTYCRTPQMDENGGV